MKKKPKSKTPGPKTSVPAVRRPRRPGRPKLPCTECGKKAHAISSIFLVEEMTDQQIRDTNTADAWEATTCNSCSVKAEAGYRVEILEKLDEPRMARMFGIPEQFIGASFDDFPKSKKLLKSYWKNYLADEKGDMVLVTGPTGTGKTRLLYAFYREVIADTFADVDENTDAAPDLYSLAKQLRSAAAGRQRHVICRQAGAPPCSILELGKSSSGNCCHRRLEVMSEKTPGNGARAELTLNTWGDQQPIQKRINARA